MSETERTTPALTGATPTDRPAASSCPPWCTTRLTTHGCQGLHSAAASAWPTVWATASDRHELTTGLTPTPAWWEADDEPPTVVVHVEQTWSGVGEPCSLDVDDARRLAELLATMGGERFTDAELASLSPVRDRDGGGGFVVDRVVTVMLPPDGPLRGAELVELYSDQALDLAQALREAASAAASVGVGHGSTCGSCGAHEAGDAL